MGHLYHVYWISTEKYGQFNSTTPCRLSPENYDEVIEDWTEHVKKQGASVPVIANFIYIGEVEDD